ncbi:replication-relaxation family protein [Streptomyces mirabilis]|uniref:replication-relaxation family protein n=1 Tax=Streptomyces mirabilis TaxID=68239 RepID=UPI00371CD70C
MIGVDAGSGDRLALGVLTPYRMATTEQMHRVIAPEVRIEQTRRRLTRLRVEGLVDRITPSTPVRPGHATMTERSSWPVERSVPSLSITPRPAG